MRRAFRFFFPRFFEGRFAASIDDVKASAAPALRHRILLSFEGEAEAVRPDAIIGEILDRLPATGAIIVAAPVKLKSGPGSSLRVVALVAR